MQNAPTKGQVSPNIINGTAACALRTPWRSLAPGEYLFQSGDRPAQPYRIERGSLCHYTRRDDGSLEIIEFVFAGDIIGFAHLGTYIGTARATMLSSVSVLPAEEYEFALKTDAHLAARVAGMADREFDYLRSRVLRSGKYTPAVRVASYLAAIIGMNAHEGRDASRIMDEISSALLADSLQMSIDRLAASLSELERQGLIQPTASGLRVVDADALQKFVDMAPLPSGPPLSGQSVEGRYAKHATGTALGHHESQAK